jgi:hypothetical protein
LTFIKTASKRLISLLVPIGWRKILIGLLVLGSVSATAWVLRDHYTGKAAKAALTQVKQDNAVLAHAATAADRAETGNLAGKAAITAKETTGLARSNKALDANPDWAQQPIPADVAASLRD